MVKIARNPISAAKNPPQTLIFHQKTSKTIDFHGFPCQNFPTVNPSSRHAYRGFNSSSLTDYDSVISLLLNASRQPREC